MFIAFKWYTLVTFAGMPNASNQATGSDGRMAVGNGARTHVQTINGRDSLVVTANGVLPSGVSTDKHVILITVLDFLVAISLHLLYLRINLS